MPSDNFCFYLQNRLIQTSQTGGQWHRYTSPSIIPWTNALAYCRSQRKPVSPVRCVRSWRHPGTRRQSGPRRQTGANVIKNFFLRRR
jgi:hypothetical protein